MSKKYTHSRTKLKWQCAQNHLWETAPELITAGNWCPHCSGTVVGNIQLMQKLARQRGGKCLSKDYTNSAHKLKWQCNKGHVWESTPAHIKRGSWCHECAGMVKIKLEQLQQHAITKNGKCLSKEYNGRHDQIK